MFFDEEMVIDTKDGKKQTVNCVVMDDITQEPLDENMLDTESTGISITFRRSDWYYIGNIMRGDKIYRPQFNKWYSVTDVLNDFALGFIVKAREIGGKK